MKRWSAGRAPRGSSVGIGRARLRAVADRLADVEARLAESERRLENTVRMGPVTDVDPVKQLYRQEIGRDTDGTVQKGPWRPYSQHAGALKIHSPPTVGQLMMKLSPSGDIEQGVGFPFGWSDANAAPGQTADHVLSYLSKISVTMSDGKLVATIPETTFMVDDAHSFTLDKTGMLHTGPVMARPDKDSPPKAIDHTHKHGGVTPGGGDTDIPA